MTKHSATPWSLYADGYIYSSEYEAIPIVECDINNIDIDEREANKELIVKAVNCYTDMEQLVLEAYHGIRSCRSYEPINEHHLIRAEEALEKALKLLEGKK